MSDIVAKLRDSLGDLVCTDDEVLDAHRRDYWALAELNDAIGKGPPRPCCVVLASCTEDVVRTLRTCRESGVPVIPFGGASGVCGAIEASPESVVLSTRDIEGLVRIDDQNLTATFRAGTMGIDAERRVQQDGLTIGNWPQSVELSTVGGWVATRAAGQYSTAYGSIEDLVLALEVVLPDGSIVRTRETPRAAAGPDLRNLFMGSEGILGVVTEVTFSLRPLPEATKEQAFHFPSLESGIEAIRRFMRAGWRPPVVRLYDAHESQRIFSDYTPEDRNLLILLHDGPVSAVEAQFEGVAELCQAAGGAEADSACVSEWLGHRNKVPGFKELNDRGLVVDTIEVASTWSRVADLYERVTRALREMPEVLIASAHSSHSYRSGTNLYFTFVARAEDRARMPEIYSECWDRTMQATVEAGAGVAHHHGIGRVRRGRLVDEVGESGVALLRKIKSALDPQGLLNPGALLPPEKGE
ncbi:MAG: FAD-binding oxidoreductase [bacterium]|nr:FAD-binding oxidoreductase [bacterium]